MPSEVRDIRMIAKAVEQRWPVGNDQRKALVERLMRVITDPESSPREVTAAAKALISAEKQNQDDQFKVIDVANTKNENARISEIAADLGIDPALIVDARREAGGSAESVDEAHNEQSES